MMWKTGFILVATLTTSVSLAQPPGPGAQSPQQPQFLFFNALNLASPNAGHARIDVHFRIDSDFFVAVRNPDTSFPWPFKRRGEVFVELRDSLDVSRARESKTFELGSNTTERSFDTREWNQGIFTFDVPPGLYTIVFEVTDFESERRYLDRRRTIRAAGFGVMKHSTPVFVYPDENSTTELLLHNMGGDLYFGKKAALFLQIPTGESIGADFTLSFSINRIIPDSDEQKEILKDSATHTRIMNNVTLKPAHRNEGIAYEVTPSTGPGTAGILIPFAGEQLPLGNYRFTLRVPTADSQKTIEGTFRMIWPEMPFSLRDPEYAIEALRYVVSEDGLDSLKDHARDARIRALEEFWKPRDTTPGTAYNEVMTEYYRRVDHARRTFGTLREPDGMKSDRGRIYILYGPPTHVDRALNPDSAFQEVWEYESHKKKFIFVDERRSGNYVLVLTQTL